MCVAHVHGVCLSSEASWIVEIYQILLHMYNFTLHCICVGSTYYATI